MALVVFDQIAVFEMAVPCEVFGVDRSDMGLPTYRLLVCAAEPGPLQTKAGFSIRAPHGLEGLEEAQTVIVPAWRDLDEVPSETVLEPLRRAHRRGARVASLCSGAFVLAAAGLLDGLRATVHWMYAAQLAERYPRVTVDPSVLYVDNGSILTSAGTAAGIDLCLHMVRLDHGVEVANLYARRMVVPPHRDGGQAQFIQTPLEQRPEAAPPLADTLDWALGHLDDDLTVDALAARARLSPRTFARRFRAATGTNPIEWLIAQRVAAAQRMLERSEEPIEEVARRCGFGSAVTLRLHFSRRLGTTPTAYRRTFRSQ